jgi:hypothetical protein
VQINTCTNAKELKNESIGGVPVPLFIVKSCLTRMHLKIFSSDGKYLPPEHAPIYQLHKRGWAIRKYAGYLRKDIAKCDIK